MTSMTACHDSMLILEISAGREIPALFTSPSMEPKAEMPAATAAWATAWSVTLPTTGTNFPAVKPAAALCNVDALISTPTICPPSSMTSREMAKPIH